MSIPKPIETVFKTSTCLFTSDQVNLALNTMAEKIHAELADKNPLVLCVMIGGLIPLGNLLPRLDFPLEVDYLHATRYEGKTRGGILNWKIKPATPLKGRTVLVVDDILDGGITLGRILEYCQEEGAEKVYSAVLVEKQDARSDDGLKEADFVGLSVPNNYVFGYGMDYHNYLRNAPGIYKVAPEFE